MSLTQLLRILLARYLTLVITLAIAITIAILVNIFMPKQYTATASVYVDVRSPDAILGEVLPVGGYMTTQLDILFNQNVAVRAVKAMKLEQNETVRQQYMASTGGQGPIETWLGALLRDDLEVRPSRDSSVIDISYTAVDPRFATMVANAFANAFIDANLELRTEPARQYNSWFDVQIKELRETMEQKQKRLSEFQRKSGIIASDERIDVENARLADLSSQLVSAQAQSADTSSRQSQTKRASAESLNEVLAHPLVQGLKADVARQEAEVERLSAQYGPNYPALEREREKLSAMRTKVNNEVAKVVGGIRSASEVSNQREAEIRKELEAQRAKVMALKIKRDELALLQRESESAQRAYDAVATRLTQTNLESQANQTNVHLLNPAMEPNAHSQPRSLLNIAIAIVLGGMLGTGLALLRENMDRRIRSREDLDRLLAGVPLLANIPRGKPRFALPSRHLALPWRRDTAAA